MNPTRLISGLLAASCLLWMSSNQLAAYSFSHEPAQPTANSTPLDPGYQPITAHPAQDDDDGQPAITPKRRSELMSFVKKHHAELRPLLRSLEKKRPAEFQSALRSLDRDVKSLQAQSRRSPERYKKSLNLWIVKSKIRLVAAQLATKKTDQQRAAIKSRLKTLVTQQHNLRVSILSSDLAQAKKRVEKLSSQVEELKSTKDKRVELQTKALNRNAERILANQRKAAEAKRNQARAKKNADNSKNESPRKQNDKDQSNP